MILEHKINSRMKLLREKYVNECKLYLNNKGVKVNSKHKESLLSDAIGCLLFNVHYHLRKGMKYYNITLRERDYKQSTIVNGRNTKRTVSYVYMKRVFDWCKEEKSCVIDVGGSRVWSDREGKFIWGVSIFHISDIIEKDFNSCRVTADCNIPSAVVLRDEDGEDKTYRSDEYIRSSVRAVESYNKNTGNFVVADSSGLVYDTQVRRIFNESFERGGRMYMTGQSVQQLSGDERPNLNVDGGPVVELDFKALHPRILYDTKGIDIGLRDPYQIPLTGYNPKLLRSVCKLALNIMFNSKDKRSAYRALNFKVMEKLDVATLSDIRYCPGKIESSRILDYLYETNKEISEYFYSDAGARLQKLDSEIMMDVVSYFVQRGKVIIPVHDSCVVREEDELEAKEQMIEAYHDHVGSKLNCIVERKQGDCTLDYEPYGGKDSYYQMLAQQYILPARVVKVVSKVYGSSMDFEILPDELNEIAKFYT